MHKRSTQTKQLTFKERSPNKKASSSHLVTTPSLATTPRYSEVEALKQEVAELRTTLKITLEEVAEVKKHYEAETTNLQKSYEEVKKEVETLKFEKDEKSVRQSSGIEEYSMLTLELIRLRTEIDRLSNLYDRERRNNNMRIIEDKMHKDSYVEEYN